MRTGIMSHVATESIAFQDGKLFQELTGAIERLDGVNKAMGKDKYFLSEPVIEISRVLKKFTGITFVMEDGTDTGPAMMPPRIDNKHVFWNNELREVMDMYPDLIDAYSDIRPLLKKMDTEILNGTVDSRAAKVTGVFEKLDIQLFMPIDLMKSRSNYTAQEVAAIILHEVGHAFTFFEFITRSITTNQVLSALIRCNDKTMPSDKRKILFTKGADLLRMTREQRDALEKSKTENEICVIVIDSAITLSVSELGASCYDANSCEFLADQFSNRQRAGKALATGLDKLMRDVKYQNKKSSVTDYLIIGINWLAVILIFAALTIYTAGLIWPYMFFYLIFSQDKSENIYDSPKSRFNRIKQDCIVKLKDKDLTQADKKFYVETVETVDTVAKAYDDNLSFFEKMAYYLKPSYRNAHKYELIQKQLEAFASNDLFTASAKLSTI